MRTGMSVCMSLFVSLSLCQDGKTVLHIACEEDQPEILALLLGVAAIKQLIDMIDGYEQTALMHVAQQGLSGYAERLLAAGADHDS
eukprot:m.663448 g.663448  ORF g.663448 m.663448 type:complete len:86 (+) comp58486_c0_seq23:64-321(+)